MEREKVNKSWTEQKRKTKQDLDRNLEQKATKSFKKWQRINREIRGEEHKS